MKALLSLISLVSALSCKAAEIRWTVAQSPINITKDFEVPPNDTLVIDAGVVVNAPHGGRLVPYENSKVRIAGTKQKPVVFIGGGIDALKSDNQIFAEYLIMTNGWIQTGGSARRFEAYDCTFRGTQFSTRGKTNILKRNIFLGQVYWDIANTTILNSLFSFPPGVPSEVVLFNWPPATTFIRYNTFLEGNLTVIRSGTFDISLNYWSTTDIQAIGNRIIDRSDTFSSPGFVSFSPFLTVPHPDTPPLPDLSDPPKSPVLAVRKSITLEFLSEPLIYYQIEGSNNMKDWQVISEKFPGDGGSISRYLDAEGRFLFYRVVAHR